jgi:hypothetical protein
VLTYAIGYVNISAFGRCCHRPICSRYLSYNSHDLEMIGIVWWSYCRNGCQLSGCEEFHSICHMAKLREIYKGAVAIGDNTDRRQQVVVVRAHYWRFIMSWGFWFHKRSVPEAGDTEGTGVVGSNYLFCNLLTTS